MKRAKIFLYTLLFCAVMAGSAEAGRRGTVDGLWRGTVVFSYSTGGRASTVLTANTGYADYFTGTLRETSSYGTTYYSVDGSKSRGHKYVSGNFLSYDGCSSGTWSFTANGGTVRAWASGTNACYGYTFTMSGNLR